LATFRRQSAVLFAPHRVAVNLETAVFPRQSDIGSTKETYRFETDLTCCVRSTTMLRS
jgi:hypothetical protein